MLGEQKIGSFKRLPDYNGYFSVDPGLSNEWDMFWLMNEERTVCFFEIYYDYRIEKIIFNTEYVVKEEVDDIV